MVVRPILTYGSLVWWTCTEKSYVQNKLGTIQRAACVAITGAIKSTPTLALNIILNFNPLDIEVKKLAAL